MSEERTIVPGSAATRGSAGNPGRVAGLPRAAKPSSALRDSCSAEFTTRERTHYSMQLPVASEKFFGTHSTSERLRKPYMQHKSRVQGAILLSKTRDIVYMICGSVPSSVPKFIYEFRGLKKNKCTAPAYVVPVCACQGELSCREPHDSAAK